MNPLKQIRLCLGLCGLVMLNAVVHAENTVTVYAAASLTNAMNDLEKIYEQKIK